MFLTPDELEQLTGSDKPFMQRRWLRERAWIFEVSARGAPIVLASYAEKRMGGAPGATPKRDKPKVDVEAL